jgi:orotidine-5'-phosphate decarboxylase
VNDPRVIVALDFPTLDQAQALVERLDPSLCKVKVGSELFTAAGPAWVGRLVHAGFEVFLDLKYHDIPNTVAAACCAAADLGVWMLNVHAHGGRAMLEAARNALAARTKPPLLIAVTVLTSLGPRDLQELGLREPPDALVLRLASLVRAAGLDGVVCSAREAAALRAHFGAAFKLVTPGVRPRGAAADDQQRVATPGEAVALCADYLVIGRPVTRAVDPIGALRGIDAEVAAALRQASA